MRSQPARQLVLLPLNESPSEKEGKCGLFAGVGIFNAALNESPSEKEGKLRRTHARRRGNSALNESPSEKEGKFHT